MPTTCRKGGQDRHREEESNSPDSNVFGTPGQGTAKLRGKLVGVYADFQDVVHQREQRCKREGGNKEGDKSKLNHHLEVLVEKAVFRQVSKIVILLPACQLATLVLGLNVVSAAHVHFQAGNEDLESVIENLLTDHDDGQLLSKLNQTSTAATFIQSVACTEQRQGEHNTQNIAVLKAACSERCGVQHPRSLTQMS